MSATAPPPPSAPPSGRGRRIPLFVTIAGALTFLLAGSYVIENLRGERAWARAQARMARESESLEPTRLWPDPLPPGENAATTPALDGLVEVVDRDEAKGVPAEKRARLATLDIHHQNADPRPALVPGAIQWPAWRDYLIGPLRDGSWPELLAQMEPLRQRIQQAKNHRNPHALLLTIGPPISITLNHKIIRLEYTRRQAVAACALERHFLQHQDYPDSLRSLVPAFLPAVPEDLDALPLRYAPDPLNSRFRLWSVGTNLSDEGQGNPSPNPRPIDHGFRHEEEADWVLRFPAENP